MRVYLGLGSNLGNRQEYLEFAIRQISKCSQINNIICSSIYQSSALEVNETQNDYLNLVLAFDYSSEMGNIVKAQKMLMFLQGIENSAQRERPYFHAPRTLDIDVLLFGNIKCNESSKPILTLPHLQIINRLFVLIPLLEVLNSHEKLQVEKLINIDLDKQVEKMRLTQKIKIYSSTN